ncbi:hypothetical protein K9U40_23840, partial [Xanthobacter autotrophicus]|uniref:hypothetical protein n=1 Tax=Xanthobacter autotrophicus TaxID=280 RepID=UPI0024AB32A1|nr:hypothetical protein [Xanthobacter autotrophicus]
MNVNSREAEAQARALLVGAHDVKEEHCAATGEVAHGPLHALCLIARLHHIACDPATLAHRLGLAANDRIGTQELLQAAKLIGLKAKKVRSSVSRLALSPL